MVHLLSSFLGKYQKKTTNINKKIHCKQHCLIQALRKAQGVPGSPTAHLKQQNQYSWYIFPYALCWENQNFNMIFLKQKTQPTPKPTHTPTTFPIESDKCAAVP